MRTLREILETPIECAIPARVDNSPISLLDAIGTIMYRFSLSSQEELPQCRQIYTLLCELTDLANAPAPDVNAALVANEECQELLAEVKAQNAGLLSACKSARDYIGKMAGSAWGLMTYTELDVSITNAEASQRPAHAELRGFFAEDSSQPLTAREKMERDTA